MLMLDLMDENKRERRYFTINCFSTSIRLNGSLSAAHKSGIHVGILREQFRKVLSAVYTDAVGLYKTGLLVYCSMDLGLMFFFQTRVQNMW